ncbi:hypothetical protein LOD99_5465 [Oopsacas minuta]|uniref:UAS domain-containing protein n=1 Tax=Oopsacas minuta TaxID=111878 RepID=A0AAV7JRK5_9METZ|nr:hypothetical protein LOD99_5465 [Oopsacas minuta]
MQNITEFVDRAYHAYFKVKLGDQDKSWAPHKNLLFDQSLIVVIYLVPISIEFLGLYDDEDGANLEEVNDHDYEYDVDFQGPSSEPSLFNQAELNDLIRDLNLSKESSELLASRLKEKIQLQQGTKVILYRYREQELQQYFCEKNGLVFCPNVEGLLLAMGVPNYNPSDWRLFIDSSKRSLKCVLLHNGNIFDSIPIGYSVKLKEEYNNVKGILEIINYSAHD